MKKNKFYDQLHNTPFTISKEDQTELKKKKNQATIEVYNKYRRMSPKTRELLETEEMERLEGQPKNSIIVKKEKYKKEHERKMNMTIFDPEFDLCDFNNKKLTQSVEGNAMISEYTTRKVRPNSIKKFTTYDLYCANADIMSIFNKIRPQRHTSSQSSSRNHTPTDSNPAVQQHLARSKFSNTQNYPFTSKISPPLSSSNANVFPNRTLYPISNSDPNSGIISKQNFSNSQTQQRSMNKIFSVNVKKTQNAGNNTQSTRKSRKNTLNSIYSANSTNTTHSTNSNPSVKCINPALPINQSQTVQDFHPNRGKNNNIMLKYPATKNPHSKNGSNDFIKVQEGGVFNFSTPKHLTGASNSSIALFPPRSRNRESLFVSTKKHSVTSSNFMSHERFGDMRMRNMNRMQQERKSIMKGIGNQIGAESRDSSQENRLGINAKGLDKFSNITVDSVTKNKKGKDPVNIYKTFNALFKRNMLEVKHTLDAKGQGKRVNALQQDKFYKNLLEFNEEYYEDSQYHKILNPSVPSKKLEELTHRIPKKISKKSMDKTKEEEKDIIETLTARKTSKKTSFQNATPELLREFEEDEQKRKTAVQLTLSIQKQQKLLKLEQNTQKNLKIQKAKKTHKSAKHTLTMHSPSPSYKLPNQSEQNSKYSGKKSLSKSVSETSIFKSGDLLTAKTTASQKNALQTSNFKSFRSDMPLKNYDDKNLHVINETNAKEGCFRDLEILELKNRVHKMENFVKKFKQSHEKYLPKPEPVLYKNRSVHEFDKQMQNLKIDKNDKFFAAFQKQIEKNKFDFTALYKKNSRIKVTGNLEKTRNLMKTDSKMLNSKFATQIGREHADEIISRQFYNKGKRSGFKYKAKT